MTVVADPEELLAFWFAQPAERWFASDPAFDAALRERFGAWIEPAATRALDAWRLTARGSLALVLLLDQLPRNLFRGTPRAFAYDARARDLTHHALEAGFDRDLDDAARLFLYLPLEHSEELADQQVCCALMAPLGEFYHGFALRHREIVERFGRFPHRNAILGRESTAEERAFLEEPNSSF